MLTTEQMTISQIKQYLKDGNIEEEWLDYWRVDQRKGVRQLIKKYELDLEEKRQLQLAYEEMLTYEKEWRQKGFQCIAGIDEVGRGPLAGPVTACAAVLPDDVCFPGLTDSKKLSKKKRDYYADLLKDKALAYHIVHIPAPKIDQLNIYQASKEAMVQAVTGLKVKADALFIDALKIPLAVDQLCLIKGDSKSASIAAASVLAKTERDCYMTQIAEIYPEYGFHKHMGYGTKEHLQALHRYGPSPEHRRSFSPVQEVL